VDRRLLSIAELSAYLNLKRSTLYAKLWNIPHYRIGRLIRFRLEDIDSWLQKNKVGAEEFQTKAKKIVHQVTARSSIDVQQIIKRNIDQVKAGEYNLSNGKLDQVKGLGRGVKNGTV